MANFRSSPVERDEREGGERRVIEKSQGKIKVEWSGGVFVVFNLGGGGREIPRTNNFVKDTLKKCIICLKTLLNEWMK